MKPIVRLTPGAIAGVSCALGLFATTLAFTAAGRASALSDLAIVLSAAVGVGGAWLLAAGGDGRRGRWTLVGLSLAVGAIDAVSLALNLGHHGADGLSAPSLARLLVGFGVTDGFYRAIGLAALARVLRRNDAGRSNDQIEHAQLASATWLIAALTQTVLIVGHARHVGAGYGGMAAVALGPLMVSLLGLCAVLLLGAIVRSVRWMLLWRRAMRGDGLCIVPASEWVGALPEAVYLDVRGVRLDAVLVRRDNGSGSAYRGGQLSHALSRVPSRSGRVLLTLAWRAGFAGLLLTALSLLALGELATLRW